MGTPVPPFTQSQTLSPTSKKSISMCMKWFSIMFNQLHKTRHPPLINGLLTITIHVNDIITAANETANSSNFDVYPNPSNGVLNIQTKDGFTPSKIALHDIDGRLMHTFHDPDRLDINEFHPGVYFLVGTNDNIPIKVKIVLL